MKGKIISVVIVLCFLGFVGWLSYDNIHQQDLRAEERVTYEGRVTAIEQKGANSSVYLNSNAQSITIYGGNVELAVGEYYHIILDGNGSLVNAIIIDDGG